ncbi:hypothetical protein [Halarchaeum sp. P4]|uniref:hypothetical protein n=1 Tax=Halarchaeum sp. P4 TaxID=3421639 RepID=UPI003EBDC690
MPDTDPEPRGTPVDRDARTPPRERRRDGVDGVETPERAPLGIKVICVLAALSAGLDLMGGVKLLQMGGPLDAVAALVTVGVAAAQLAIVYGLWTLERWGYVGALLVFGLSTVAASITGALGAALVGAVIVAYVWSNREYYPQPSPADRGIDSPLDDLDW